MGRANALSDRGACFGLGDDENAFGPFRSKTGMPRFGLSAVCAGADGLVFREANSPCFISFLACWSVFDWANKPDFISILGFCSVFDWTGTVTTGIGIDSATTVVSGLQASRDGKLRTLDCETAAGGATSG